MHAITPAGLATLRDAIGVRTVIDFRDANERAADGAVHWAPHDITNLHLPPLSEAGFLAQQKALSPEQMANWKPAKEGPGFDRYLYRKLVNGEAGQRAYRAFLERLAEPTTGTTVFHCSGGRDRTGIAAALVLTVLGVDERTICEDYALTGAQLEPHTGHFAAQFTASGLSEAEWIEVCRCRPETMAAFFDDLRTRYGSPLGYVETSGVGAETAAAIRAALLV